MNPASHVVMLRRSILWSAIATIVIAVVGSLIGFGVAGLPGVYSALVGAVLTALFLGLTAVIMLVAWKFQGPGNLTIYFGIIIGGWALKLVVFLVVLILLRGQPWLNGYVFFFAVLASVISSLVIDLLVLAKTRISYEGHVIPEIPEPRDPESAGA